MPNPTTEEQLLTEWNAFRDRQAQRETEINQWGVTTAETQRIVNEMLADIQNRVAEEDTRHRELVARLNRPHLGPGANLDDAKVRRAYAQWDSARTGKRIDPENVNVEAIQAYSKAYRAYIQGVVGPEQMAILNAMQSGNNTDGGVLVEPEMDMNIMTMLVETSPMRRLAATRSITTKTIGGRRRTGRASASWVFENQSRSTTTTPTFGMWKIDAHELYAQPEDTQENLEDASMNVESWLGQEIADEFGYAENTAFVTGTGVGQPRGFTTYTAGTPSESSWDVIEQVVSGHATQVTADGIVNLVGSLKTPYLAGSSFVMRRSTMTACIELKDAVGNYMLRPDFSNGFMWRMVGFPVTEFPDMAAVGAGNLAIAFGDWKRAYLIVDRRDMTTLRDPYTNKPFVRFYTTKRVGGDIVQPEAIKIQKISA